MTIGFGTNTTTAITNTATDLNGHGLVADTGRGETRHGWNGKG
jgi:hypothetical protein